MKSRFIKIILLSAMFCFTGLSLSSCNSGGDTKVDAATQNESVNKKNIAAVEQLKNLDKDPHQAISTKIIDEVTNSLPEFIASVNNVKVSNRPVKAALHTIKAQATHQKKPISKEQIDKIIGQILDMEIQREVLFQKGKELAINIKDEEINKVIDQLKSRHKSEEEFLKIYSERGFSIEMLKNEILRNMTVAQLIQKEAQDKVVISEKQAEEYYNNNKAAFKAPETIHAAHILIKNSHAMDEDAKKTAKKKIEDILKKATAGADFAELAKKHSEGPSASREGDLGNVSKGQMVKEFEEALFKLKPGEVSDVVETQFGYHIIKAYEKKESGSAKPFAEVKKSIKGFLKQIESGKKIESYVNDLMKKADIKRLI